MKKIFFLLLVFISAESFANVPPQNEVRILFQYSAIKEDSCKKLITILNSYNEENNPLLAGYKACATMMMAKYVFNPFSKLSSFYKGRNLLEKSIEADKENIELRFLRFSIQNSVPSFLGYKSSIDNDKLFLMNRLSTVKDTSLKQWIVSFLKQSDYVTASEKQKII